MLCEEPVSRRLFVELEGSISRLFMSIPTWRGLSSDARDWPEVAIIRNHDYNDS
jgi:hypothetical protein